VCAGVHGPKSYPRTRTASPDLPSTRSARLTNRYIMSERECHYCGKPLGPLARSTKRYCNSACRVAWFRERPVLLEKYTELCEVMEWYWPIKVEHARSLRRRDGNHDAEARYAEYLRAYNCIYERLTGCAISDTICSCEPEGVPGGTRADEVREGRRQPHFSRPREKFQPREIP
jgi:hypothetical protein